MSSTSTFTKFSGAILFSGIALKNPDSKLRGAYLVLILALSWICWLDLPTLIESQAMQSAFSLFILVWMLHITALLTIERRALISHCDHFTWKDVGQLIFDFRRIGQKSVRQRHRPAQGVNLEQNMTTANTSRRSTSTFIVTRFVRLVICFCMWHIYEMNAAMLAAPIVQGANSLTQQLPVHLGRIVREGILDIYMVTEFISATYLVNNGFHSLFAIFAVGVLQIDSPEDWPLIWGGLDATWSVRGFWSKFWHRLVARTFMSWSTAVLASLGIVAGSVAGRQLLSMTVFVLSGICHGLTTWLMGFRCGWWTDVQWFAAQAVAMVVEDFWARIWTVIRRRGLKWRALERTAGFVWTWGFLMVTIGWLQSTKLKCLP